MTNSETVVVLIFAGAAFAVAYAMRASLRADRIASGKSAAKAWASAALLHIGGIAVILAAIYWPYSRRAAMLALPMVTIFAYAVQLAALRLLKDEWKNSLSFRGAALAPLLGCPFVLLIWLRR